MGRLAAAQEIIGEFPRTGKHLLSKIKAQGSVDAFSVAELVLLEECGKRIIEFMQLHLGEV